MKKAYEVARETLKENQRIMKKDYDLRVRSRAYSVGEVVYVLNTASKKGVSKKLAIQWNGPGLVVRRITPYLYKVQLRKTTSTTNHDRMKLCLTTTLPSWLTKAKEVLLQPNATTSSEDIAAGAESTVFVKGQTMVVS